MQPKCLARTRNEFPSRDMSDLWDTVWRKKEPLQGFKDTNVSSSLTSTETWVFYLIQKRKTLDMLCS